MIVQKKATDDLRTPKALDIRPSMRGGVIIETVFTMTILIGTMSAAGMNPLLGNRIFGMIT